MTNFKTIIILGISKVGKTSIIKRITKNRYEDKYIETIGIKYLIKVLIIIQEK